MKAYKGFTHDLRSPIQGGDPVWNGELPYALERVDVNRDPFVVCGAGWNACKTVEDVLAVSGFWPNGFALRVFEVEAVDEDITSVVTTRVTKLRASTWTILRECTKEEIYTAIHILTGWSHHVFFRKDSSAFSNVFPGAAEEQVLWMEALSRPNHDIDRVRECLRKISSRFVYFDNPRDIWARRYYSASLTSRLRERFSPLSGGIPTIQTNRYYRVAQWTVSLDWFRGPGLYLGGEDAANALRVFPLVKEGFLRSIFRYLREAYFHGLGMWHQLAVREPQFGWTMIEGG